MPNNDDVSMREAIKVFLDILKNDKKWQEALGRHTVTLIIATVTVAALELMYGLPIITLASTPFVGAIITFLLGSVRTYLNSGKPRVFFYLCPNPKCARPDKFIPISWESLPLYRKFRACDVCGSELVTRCPRGKHFIISPSPETPSQSPRIDGFCPLCDPHIPVQDRRYLQAAQHSA